MGRFDAYLDDDVPAAKSPGRFDAYLDKESGGNKLLPQPQATHLDVKSGKVVPNKRVRAVFTDFPGSSPMTAEEVEALTPNEAEPKSAAQSMEDLATGRTTPKQNAAFIGGALQGATLFFGDELAAGVGALRGEGSYRQLRDENRSANKEARSWDPTLNTAGQLTGGSVLMAGAPGLGPAAGKPLLTLANTGRAAAVGGAQALGESEADLTRGELAPAAWDVAKGALVGAGVNTAMGGLGKAVRAASGYVQGLPERLAAKEDAALIDASTLGAPASQRDALMGPLGQDRPDVLKLIRSNPEIETALKGGDRQRAALLLRDAQAQAASRADSGVKDIELAKGNIDVRPVLAKLEEQRAALAANPSIESQAAAAKKQKLIESIQERWLPPEAPKGNALLGRLMEGADAGDKQRAGMKAKDFLKVANEAKLGTLAGDDEKILAATEKQLSKMGKEREKLYGRLGVASDVPIGNVTAKLMEWKSELERSASGLEDAPKVDNLIERIWKAHGRDGRAGMSAEELRDEITKIQNKAFSGSYLDPAKSAEMGREAAARMRQALDEHIAMIDQSLPPDSEIGKKIADLNRRYGPMIAFRDAAEKRVAAARLKPPAPPDTRTGKASVGELRSLASSTEDAEARRAVTGGLYEQVGPEASHTLASFDREQELMSRLQAPLEHKAAREASPPTTLRSATHKLADLVTDKGAAGLGVVGTGLAAGGHYMAGGTALGAALAVKYGAEVGARAERALGAMVAAQRLGAKPSNLVQIGKALRLPAGVTQELLSTVLPRAAVSGVSSPKEEE